MEFLLRLSKVRFLKEARESRRVGGISIKLMEVKDNCLREDLRSLERKNARVFGERPLFVWESVKVSMSRNSRFTFPPGSPTSPGKLNVSRGVLRIDRCWILAFWRDPMCK